MAEIKAFCLFANEKHIWIRKMNKKASLIGNIIILVCLILLVYICVNHTDIAKEAVSWLLTTIGKGWTFVMEKIGQ